MQKFTDTTNHSVAWIKRTNDDGNLDMKAPFQRNPVWTNKQKGSLIETILLEYPIPEIYIQTVVDEDGGEKHIVVDGQQRIRSVLEYISGEYEIEEEGSKWQGMTFDDLVGSDKKKIYEYKFVTRVLPSIPDAQLRDIFQRINRNTVTLNPQELRHATYWGDFIKLMEEIADYNYWNEFSIFSANDRRRMFDVEFVSELAVAYLNGIQNKKIKLEDYYQIYETEFDKTTEVREVFRSVLGELYQTFPHLRGTRWRKKSDFYTLFIAMTRFSDEYPLERKQRLHLRFSLDVFGRSVDEYLRDRTIDARGEVITYANNVERAASDLGTRKVRDSIISSMINKILKDERISQEQKQSNISENIQETALEEEILMGDQSPPAVEGAD